MTKPFKTKPPAGGSKISDWIGKKVKSLETFKNHFWEIPKGSVGVITEVTHGKGVCVTFNTCDCCKVKPKMSGIRTEYLEVLEVD